MVHDDDDIPEGCVGVYEGTVPIARVCEGFSRDAMLTVYDTPGPSGMVCFSFRGRHYHAPLILLSNEATPAAKALAICQNPGLAMGLAMRGFLGATPEERADMEVTTEIED